MSARSCELNSTDVYFIIYVFQIVTADLRFCCLQGILEFFKGMIFLLASLSFILELLREADLFIISGILFFIVVIVLAQDQPAVFSAKWFLISFCSFMLILLNTLPFLQEYHQLDDQNN